MSRILTPGVLVWVAILSCFPAISTAQDSSSSASWSSTTQQSSSSTNVNPTRTNRSHSESNGRVLDKTSVETLGSDGRYLPYSDTEKESVRVDANTVRTTERSFGRGTDGQRTLIVQSETVSLSLADGERKMERTTSNPDADGRLRATRREEMDSKEIAKGLRETNTTVFSPDVNGGMSPSVRVAEREKQLDGGGVEFSKSTQLSDGAGNWNLSEVREGTVKPESGQDATKEERVLRPDSTGKLTEVERTVSKQAAAPGQTRETTETYSTNVPGVAGDDHLHLVSRDTVVQRAGASGQSTMRQTEGGNPGNPDSGLRVTEQAIDIVRPAGSGSAQQRSTMVTLGPDGQVNAVLVDTGKTSNPSAIHVDMGAGSKPK